MSEEDTKIIYEGKHVCPHCGKKLITKVKRKTIEPAVKGEYVKELIVEKDEQKTIEETTKK